ncbi:MAG: hypothetical protein Q8O89_06390 [Nanoarchaeota archaeon]|nr:hypothetical protein [Nanoarchaeota archaeon]
MANPEYFLCASCNNYFKAEDAIVDFQGHKIKGCPYCKKLDFLKPVFRADYLQGLATKKFTMGK